MRTSMAGGRAAYDALAQRYRRISLVGDAIGVLHWDMAVVMPPGGAGPRGEQIAALEVLRHELLADPAMGDLLSAAAEEPSLDPWQRANAAEIARIRTHAVALPADLVEARARANAACEQAWRRARPASDFAAVVPLLREVVRLTREAAAAKAAALDLCEYDALLDGYEPGGRAARIGPVLEDYARFLPDFLDDVLARQVSRPLPVAPAGPFPAAAQDALARRMAAVVGLDFDSARLDQSHHPFSGGVPEDSRITTRFEENDFASSLLAVMHETGHAMYERGLPPAWRNQPVGGARGMVLHESQSLLVEMQVGRSRQFLAWAAPIVRDAFAGSGPAWEAENLYRLLTRVGRSFIRVNADEVTYPAHVILRFRLERQVLAGDLDVADLPAAWNDGFEVLLGVRPPDDRRGCLQDIHWYDGAWGYFPTYTLGAMAAAQLFQAATAQDSQIAPALATGDFRPLMAWLGAHVHGKASLLTTDEVLEQATGRPLDATAFRTHLQHRYLEA